MSQKLDTSPAVIGRLSTGDDCIASARRPVLPDVCVQSLCDLRLRHPQQHRHRRRVLPTGGLSHAEKDDAFEEADLRPNKALVAHELLPSAARIRLAWQST
jgi:hypothetical protein